MNMLSDIRTMVNIKMYIKRCFLAPRPAAGAAAGAAAVTRSEALGRIMMKEGAVKSKVNDGPMAQYNCYGNSSNPGFFTSNQEKISK
jgi:hypothetical protein